MKLYFDFTEETVERLDRLCAPDARSKFVEDLIWGCEIPEPWECCDCQTIRAAEDKWCRDCSPEKFYE